MSKDQRAFPRINVNWSAACARVDPPGPPWAVRVSNVSESGFGVMSARSLPGGAIVDLRVLIPPRGGDHDAHTLRVRGKVVHAVFRKDEFLLGVQVLTLSDEDHQLLRRWVNRPMMEARDLASNRPV